VDGIFDLLGAFGPFAIAFGLLIVGALSKRFGEVAILPPYYRWCYVAAGLAALAGISQVIHSYLGNAPEGAFFSSDLFALLGYTLPLMIALLIGVGITFYYWKWLLKQQDQK
jgi:hypothetical protein